MRHGYEDPDFVNGASDYYDVDAAVRFFDSPVPEGCFRWRCVLCGWGLDIVREQLEVVGACCCGGCGMTTLRPIEEWSGKKNDPKA